MYFQETCVTNALSFLSITCNFNHMLVQVSHARTVVATAPSTCGCPTTIASFYLSHPISSAALILGEIEVLDEEYPSVLLPDRKDMVNFQRCRNFTRAIQHIQRYQSIPYHFHAIKVRSGTGAKVLEQVWIGVVLCLQIMQLYLGNLKKCLADEDIDKLSTKVESFTI